MKKLRNENGYSLLLVFFVLMLISIAGISLLTVSANSLKTSSNERKDQSIYYIAEAGLNFKKAEIHSALSKAEKTATDKVTELQLKVEEGKVSFPDADIAKEAYNQLYITTLETELKSLLLEGKEKITTQYNNFEVSNYKSSPHSLVTIRLANNNNGLIYDLESFGNIEGKIRKVITTIEITPEVIDITTGSPDNSSGNSSGGGNNGANTNPYEDSLFNKKGTNLVVTEEPNLTKKFKEKTKYETINSYVLNVSKQNDEDFETALDRAVSVITDPAIRELNKQYLIHKNACDTNIFGDGKIYDSLSATQKNPQNFTLTNNVVYIKGDIFIDKSTLTFTSASPVNIVICGSLKETNGNSSKLLGNPAKNINLFIMSDEDISANNIELQTNYLFAPTTTVTHGGNVNICSTLLVKTFSGNGNGGFTSACSKPTLIDPPVDTSPPIESDSAIFIPSDSPFTSTVTSEGIIEE